MSLTITEPIKTVNGLLTKTLAADSQLLYNIQRKDEEASEGSANSGGVSSFLIPGVDVSSQYSVGDQLSWVDVELRNPGNGPPNGLYIVSNVVYSNPDTYISYGIPIGTYASSSGFINNLTTHPNYRIEIEIRDADNTFSILDTSFVYVPNQSGLLDIDVSKIITFFMRSRTVDFAFAFSYFLRITEKWNGSSESATSTTVLQAVLARKQLLSVGGANMWENLLRAISTNATFSAVQDVSGCRLSVEPQFTDSTNLYIIGDFVDVKFSGVNYIDGTYLVIAVSFTSDITRVTIDLAFNGTTSGELKTASQSIPKLLTKFKNPVMWTGWNRTVAILVDSEYQNRNNDTRNRIETDNYDVNKVLLSARGQIYNQSVLIDGPNVIIASLLEPEAFYTVVKVTPDGSTLYSDLLFYKTQGECENPIMLDWINGLGGVDQWLFEVQQSVTLENDEGIVVESPITTDIEFISRTKRRFANTFRQQLTLKAEHLTIDQLLALQEIKQTESLRLYLSKDGTNFIDAIVVNDFSSPYSTKDRQHKFTVIIELPDGFIFEQGKLY